MESQPQSPEFRNKHRDKTVIHGTIMKAEPLKPLFSA